MSRTTDTDPMMSPVRVSHRSGTDLPMAQLAACRSPDNLFLVFDHLSFESTQRRCLLNRTRSAVRAIDLQACRHFLHVYAVGGPKAEFPKGRRICEGKGLVRVRKPDFVAYAVYQGRQPVFLLLNSGQEYPGLLLLPFALGDVRIRDDDPFYAVVGGPVGEYVPDIPGAR